MKENRTPNTLSMAAYPQLRIPMLFISKEYPIRSIERKSRVNPTTKGKMTMDIPG
ncbi:MAG: hypothetical protein MZV63_17685 [Marinilabiliales bacterium]|nr:hypothetical protein [Marinilabiliales bacterium]